MDKVVKRTYFCTISCLRESEFMSKKILIVEDEPGIADNIRLALKREGMDSHTCYFGGEALDYIAKEKVDLVTLDIGLPDMMGVDICKKIREVSSVPVIFLTARDNEIDKVLGLEMGADDYLVKPFSPRELVARIKAVLRRTEGNGLKSEKLSNSAGLLVDEARKIACYQSQDIPLTPHEFGILRVLAEHPGRVCSREHLLQVVWQDDFDINDRVVDTHIKSIRAKFQELERSGLIEAAANLIKTHRGFGYSLEKGSIN